MELCLIEAPFSPFSLPPSLILELKVVLRDHRIPLFKFEAMKAQIGWAGPGLELDPKFFWSTSFSSIHVSSLQHQQMLSAWAPPAGKMLESAEANERKAVCSSSSRSTRGDKSHIYWPLPFILFLIPGKQDLSLGSSFPSAFVLSHISLWQAYPGRGDSGTESGWAEWAAPRCTSAPGQTWLINAPKPKSPSPTWLYKVQHFSKEVFSRSQNKKEHLCKHRKKKRLHPPGSSSSCIWTCSQRCLMVHGAALNLPSLKSKPSERNQRASYSSPLLIPHCAQGKDWTRISSHCDKTV